MAGLVIPAPLQVPPGSTAERVKGVCPVQYGPVEVIVASAAFVTFTVTEALSDEQL